MINRHEKRLLIILGGTIVFGSIVFGRAFLSLSTLNILGHQLPEVGLISLALTICIIGSGINLSVVSTTTLAGIIGGLVMTGTGDMGLISLVLGIMTILAVSAIAGAVNGFIISYIEVPPILTTLGTLMLFRGIGLNLTKGSAVSGFGGGLTHIGNATVLGIPVPLIIFVVTAVLLFILLEHKNFGQQLYRIGKNKEAAVYSGIPVSRIIFLVYVLSGVILGVAAIVMMARYNSIRADYGASYLMISIVVVTIGGVSINGGKGSILGVVISLVLFNLVIRILSIADIDTEIIDAILGILLLLNIFSQYVTDKGDEIHESQI